MRIVPNFSRRLWFSIVLLVVCVAEVEALFVPSPPVLAHGTRPLLVSEFGRGLRVGQTFRMPADGLTSVGLLFSADRPAQLHLTCRLMTAMDYTRETWQPLYEWTTMIRVPRGVSWRHFQFRPVYPSERKLYQFQVQQLDVDAIGESGRGRPVVDVVASVDDALKEGNIVADGNQVIDRDLFFQARAADTGFDLFRMRAAVHLPVGLRYRAVQLTLLVCINVIACIFCVEMILADRGEDDLPPG